MNRRIIQNQPGFPSQLLRQHIQTSDHYVRIYALLKNKRFKPSCVMPQKPQDGLRFASGNRNLNPHPALLPGINHFRRQIKSRLIAIHQVYQAGGSLAAQLG